MNRICILTNQQTKCTEECRACVKEIYSELKRKHLKNKFILESSIKEEIGENEFEVLKQYGFIDYIGVVNNIKAYSL